MRNEKRSNPNRREFLAAAGASTATTVVAAGPVMSQLDPTNSESPHRRPKRPVVDGHTHMLMGRGNKHQVSDLKEIDLSKLFKQMDDYGIEMFISVVQETQRVWGDWTGTNDLIVDLQKSFPERFRGVFGAEPLDKSDVLNQKRLEEFEVAVKRDGIKGLWFGPPYQHIYANDKRIYPYYEVAQEYGVVVYYHHAGGIGGGGGPANSAPLKYAKPILLDDVVIDFPDLRIMVEHMAYPWTEELLALMRHAPNVYTDVTALFQRPTILAWYVMMAKEYGVIERVIWGTDYDVYWNEDYDTARYFKRVQKETSWIERDLNTICRRAGWSICTQEEINGILHGNVKRLWKL
jgi:predicted TIM-barrel fold metal-dependent hydrolase